MDVRITIETTFENGKKLSHHLGHFSRPFRQAQPESFGRHCQRRTFIPRKKKANLTTP